jgi:hypothetical protein
LSAPDGRLLLASRRSQLSVRIFGRIRRGRLFWSRFC